MQTVLLINKDDVTHYTSVSGSIDEFKLNVHINNAQILYIEPILGSSLYERLLDLVDTNTISGFTDYNNLLINYITPSLVFHTIELYVPLNAFQVAEGGMFQYSPNNYAYSPLNDIDRISAKYRIIGEKYDSKLASYLCKNSNLFTEYENNTGLIERSDSNIRVGWNLSTKYTTNKIRK